MSTNNGTTNGAVAVPAANGVAGDANSGNHSQASILKTITPADGECDLCEKGVPDHHHDICIGDPDATEVDLTHCRIGRIANLEKGDKLEYLCLRWNLIVKIEGLDALENLRELDLYDNQIVKIDNLDGLKKLVSLDLSFNRLVKIENLSCLADTLKKLYFVENRLERMENLEALTKLEMLELGSNKLRKIEGIDTLVDLQELFLGRNRIRALDTGLTSLRNLRILSLASNRLTRIEGLENLESLEQLYLSSNAIEKIEGLEKNLALNTLDLAENKIDRIENITHLINLEEFWPPQEGAHVSELVELIADRTSALDVKIQAAVMLQHLTYLDPFVKAEVAAFNVSHHLVALLASHHHNQQIPRVFTLAILGVLRNLCSGADSIARLALTTPNTNHLAVLLDIITRHQSADVEETAVRELATAVLWNISVDTELAVRLTESGVLDVVSRAILLPSIHLATKTPLGAGHTWAGWCTDFKNSSGVLRNCTAVLDQAVGLVNGVSGLAPLRMLLESFTHAVRFSVAQQDTESKAVENCVCFLQNVTAAICAESTRTAKLKRAASTPNVADNDHAVSSLGCALVGSQWCLSKQNRTATMMAASRAGGVERRGPSDQADRQLISVACARSLVEALLPLLADCSNPTTLEAGLGTIRNVVSIASMPVKLRDLKSSQQTLVAEPCCCDVAREAVWRSGGLPIIVDLLAITSDGVLRAAASVLAALGTTALGAADTDGVLVIRELIGKQALDRLVRKLPTPNDATLTESFPSDTAICSILAAILVIVRPFSQQQQAAFHQQIMTPSSPAAFSLHAISDLALLTRLHFLVRPERFGFSQVQFDPQVKRLASAVSATLWQHTELRPAYSRLGIDRMAFFPSTAQPGFTSTASLPNRANEVQLAMTPANDPASLLPYGQQQFSYPADVGVLGTGSGGVYGIDASGHNNQQGTTLIENGNNKINDYLVVEERLVGSVTTLPTEAASESHASSVAARIEARRGSSSSSWTANQNLASDVEPGAANVSAEDANARSTEACLAVNSSQSTIAGHDNSSSVKPTDDDEEMFALSQLGPGMVVEEDVQTYGEPAVDNDSNEATVNSTQDETTPENVQQQQPVVNGRPISTNRELFMLALNSDAPDSWV